MQDPQRCTLDELLSSPAVARLATALQRVRVVSLDQIQRFECLWKALYQDEPPRRRRQYIRSDLQRLTRAGYLQCLSLPAIWPSPIAEYPVCRISLLEESPDFESAVEQLNRRHEALAIRQVRIYAAPTESWKLAFKDYPYSTIPHPGTSNRNLKLVDLESTLNALKKENERVAQTETTPSLDIAVARKFLSLTLSTAILSLSEIYCKTADRNAPQVCDWSLLRSPFECQLPTTSASHRPIGYAELEGRLVAVVFAHGLNAEYLCELHKGIKLHRIAYSVDEIHLW